MVAPKHIQLLKIVLLVQKDRRLENVTFITMRTNMCTNGRLDSSLNSCSFLPQSLIQGSLQKKRLKRVTLYIFGFKPTLSSQLVTQNLVTYFSKVMTHPTLRISDMNIILFSTDSDHLFTLQSFCQSDYYDKILIKR